MQTDGKSEDRAERPVPRRGTQPRAAWRAPGALGPGDLAAALLGAALLLALAAGWDRARPPDFGEPLALRWARKVAEHPGRSAVAAACLVLAWRALGGAAPGAPEGPADPLGDP
jgi:hypothetical protein